MLGHCSSGSFASTDATPGKETSRNRVFSRGYLSNCVERVDSGLAYTFVWQAPWLKVVPAELNRPGVQVRDQLWK